MATRDDDLLTEKMHYGGMTLTELARYFGISRRAVCYRLARARGFHKKMAEGLDNSEQLGNAIARLKHLGRMARERLAATLPGSANEVGFLNMALAAERELIDLFIKAGIIVKVPERIALEEDLPLDDDDFRAEYVALMAKARLMKAGQAPKADMG